MKKIPDPLEMPRWLETLHAYVQGACLPAGTVREMLADDKWPCPVCLGREWDYDPNDPPCPIEGNKMRNRITCPDCGGSGHGERSWWKNQWLAVHAQRIAEISAFASVRAVMRQALDKLTPEEAAALGWQKPDDAAAIRAALTKETAAIHEAVAAVCKVGDNA